MALLSLAFAWFAQAPLWHTDLWDHVNYGNHIFSTGEIPSTEPLISLTQGQKMICTAWSSQVILAVLVDSEFPGLAGLQFLTASLVVASLESIC